MIMDMNNKIITGYLLLIAIANSIVVYMLYDTSHTRSLLWASGSILMLLTVRNLVKSQLYNECVYSKTNDLVE